MNETSKTMTDKPTPQNTDVPGGDGPYIRKPEAGSGGLKDPDAPTSDSYGNTRESGEQPG